MVGSVTVGFYCTLLTSVWAEVIVNKEESVFSLSPSADIIAFSNYTTNNPLDNLKDFPETFDIHEFSLDSENGTEEDKGEIPDQLAVESLHHPEDHNHSQSSPSSNSSESVAGVMVSLPQPLPTVHTVTLPQLPAHPVTPPQPQPTVPSVTLPQPQPTVPSVTLPLPSPTVHTHAATEEETTGSSGVSHMVDTDAFSSLYEGVGSEWSDNITETIKEETKAVETIKEEFDSQLYEVVTSEQGVDTEFIEEEDVEEDVDEEDQRYQNLLNELRKKYGDGSIQDDVHQHEVLSEHNIYFDNHDGSVSHEKHDHGEVLEDHGHGHGHGYGHGHGHLSDHRREHMENMKNPLIMLMKIEPHALDLLVKPRQFVKGTMVRLMYERVPRNRPPMQQHLDDPVIEYVPLHWPAQHHRLQDLPMGKYIVCGEAHIEGNIIQANCFETVIDRLDNNMLQGGVVGVICVAIISIFLVIVYAIYYRLTRKSRRQEKEGKQETGSSD